MKLFEDFTAKFGCKLSLIGKNIINKSGRIFLVNKNLLKYCKRNFIYAGLYLGKIKKGKIFPSLYLLSILSKIKSNKVIVDDKASWLVICGRDVFGERILKVEGSIKKGNLVLVLNTYGECLGYGKIIRDLDKKPKQNEVFIENLLDIGDFLRRES